MRATTTNVQHSLLATWSSHFAMGNSQVRSGERKQKREWWRRGSDTGKLRCYRVRQHRKMCTSPRFFFTLTTPAPRHARAGQITVQTASFPCGALLCRIDEYCHGQWEAVELCFEEGEKPRTNMAEPDVSVKLCHARTWLAVGTRVVGFSTGVA